MSDNNLDERAAELEKSGIAKFGEDLWRARIGALAKQNPNREALAQVLASPDAIDLLDLAGRESLLTQMSGGDQEAERTYAKIREADRKTHRSLKGR
jgi:hypothetical protein